MRPGSEALVVGLAVLGGLAAFWLALVLALLVVFRGSERPALRDLVRLAPDVVRLLRRLARDPDLPRGVRVRLVLLLGYLVFPLDLVPDFLPVVGYADDALVVALAIRSVTRRAGPEALERHWPGSPEGLRALRRLCGVPR